MEHSHSPLWVLAYWVVFVGGAMRLSSYRPRAIEGVGGFLLPLFTFLGILLFLLGGVSAGLLMSTWTWDPLPRLRPWDLIFILGGVVLCCSWFILSTLKTMRDEFRKALSDIERLLQDRSQ